MPFQVTKQPTFVRVKDTANGRVHFLKPEVFATLNLATVLGAQKRLFDASDIVIAPHLNEFIKRNTTLDVVVQGYLTNLGVSS